MSLIAAIQQAVKSVINVICMFALSFHQSGVKTVGLSECCECYCCSEAILADRKTQENISNPDAGS